MLQCDAHVPVWGAARDGEKITVTFAGQEVSTVATNGTWKIWLKPMKPNATPQTLTVAGDLTSVITNVLVGEVWVASGQSNMERQLGLRPGQQLIADWEHEVAAAKYPEIRQFYVPQTKFFTPLSTVKGNWAVCSPATVKDFTAVGYFFARDLLAARHVPVGIIHSSWGGKPAEAWTSEAALQKIPDFVPQVAKLKQLIADPVLAERENGARQAAWYEKVDPTSKPGAARALDWRSEMGAVNRTHGSPRPPTLSPSIVSTKTPARSHAKPFPWSHLMPLPAAKLSAGDCLGDSVSFNIFRARHQLLSKIGHFVGFSNCTQSARRLTCQLSDRYTPLHQGFHFVPTVRKLPRQAGRGSCAFPLDLTPAFNHSRSFAISMSLVVTGV